MSLTIACEHCLVGRASYTGLSITEERGPDPLHRYHCDTCGDFFYSTTTLTDDEDEPEEPEQTPPYYLRDLADRIFKIATVHGVDGYDHDRLYSIARAIEAQAPTLDDREPHT